VASWFPGTPRARTADLRLTVARAQDGFKLTWNRAADVIARASGGVLTISEQGTERQIRLSREELMHGSVAYQPTGKDVSFRLDLTPEGETVASATLQTAAPPQDAAAALPETPKPAVSRPRPKPAPTRKFDAEKVLAARAEPVTGSADRLVIEPPPPIRPASARDSAAELSSALEPTPRPAPMLYAKIDMEPVKAGRVRRVFGRVFGVPERPFEAARPLRQVAPALPPYLRGQDLPPVEVKVHIDRDGRLERTELLSKDAPSELTERAIDALERWTFAPARVKDEAVDSELILRFDFQP
jgi:protein TonB